MTILEKMIGDATVVKTTTITGARGGCKCTVKTLDDGRVVFVTPDLRHSLPTHCAEFIPANHCVVNAGGTTYKCNNFITEPATHKITGEYNGKPFERLYVDYDTAYATECNLKMYYNAKNYTNIKLTKV